MPKSSTTKRLEVHLLPEVLQKLRVLADQENRSLKNYIETLLKQKAEEKKKVP